MVMIAVVSADIHDRTSFVIHFHAPLRTVFGFINVLVPVGDGLSGYLGVSLGNLRFPRMFVSAVHLVAAHDGAFDGGSAESDAVALGRKCGRGDSELHLVKPEILAPGTDIRSFSLRDGEYECKSGTSMSVPIVCGALALALEKNPNLMPGELKLLLYDSVSEKNKNLSPAWGILNVDNLIKML